jgi:hypothetical protein
MFAILNHLSSIGPTNNINESKIIYMLHDTKDVVKHRFKVDFDFLPILKAKKKKLRETNNLTAIKIGLLCA